MIFAYSINALRSLATEKRRQLESAETTVLQIQKSLADAESIMDGFQDQLEDLEASIKLVDNAAKERLGITS